MIVIITGSTGMVGKSVLHQCLKDERVTQVLVVNRSSVGISHPKLKEVLHSDFLDLSAINEELRGYDACFHCMGVSVVGKNEEDYTRFTYGITAEWADRLYDLNPDMVFNYVSGTGSDSSEKGRVMWARVKGRAENMVLNKGFKDAYAIRLGALIPGPGIKSRTGWINTFVVLMKPFYGLLKKMRSVITSEKLGLAMINAVLYPQELKHLENRQLNELAAASN